jgi:quercetin dioxygenase-like cupin family protein
VLLVHSGKGEVVAGENKFNVGPGDLLVVPKRERRGIKAISDMEVLHLVSPPPNDADHEEVVQKLKQGSFA